MESSAFAYMAAGLGAALAVVGAGLGIGKLAAAALEVSGRQPEYRRRYPYHDDHCGSTYRRCYALRTCYLYHSRR